mgnify:CR=1 FL=1
MVLIGTNTSEEMASQSAASKTECAQKLDRDTKAHCIKQQGEQLCGRAAEESYKSANSNMISTVSRIDDLQWKQS